MPKYDVTILALVCGADVVMWILFFFLRLDSNRSLWETLWFDSQLSPWWICDLVQEQTGYHGAPSRSQVLPDPGIDRLVPESPAGWLRLSWLFLFFVIFMKIFRLYFIPKLKERNSIFKIVPFESEWALLARYVYTYEEFVIVIEAPQCNRMTTTGQDTDNKRTIYKYTNRQCTK